MTPVSATPHQPEAPLFTDGIGDRVVAVDAATGDLLQILRVRPQLLAVPSFEFALRERAARLANFRHAYYGRVRRVDRHPSGLAIVSDHVEGVRLSDMLRVATERGRQLDFSAALCLLRQLVPSVALLHENARDVAHGLIAPERLIVTPRARLIVVEHVLGSAVEQMQYNRERLWHELRVAVPAAAGAVRFDNRADMTGIGLVALALVLGRPIAADEYPQRVAPLLNGARARAAGGADAPPPAPPAPAPQPPKPGPRDITELLGDFDLPPVTTPVSTAHDARHEPPAESSEPKRRRFSLFAEESARWRRFAAVALAIIALGEAGLIAARTIRPASPKLGTLSLQTNPPGIAVFVDGVARGNTPARISLDAGSHLVELRGRGVPRVIPVTVAAGAEASQYPELPETPSAGSLLVQSDPPGAHVTVDGVEHGIAPASVANLAPGDHEVVLRAEGGTPVHQRVVIQPGVTSSVLAPAATATPGPVSGWLSVRAPVSIEVHENGRLIGTTESDRIMMAGGHHDIELVNDTLGYRATRSIQVPAGKVMPLAVRPPVGGGDGHPSPAAGGWGDG